MAVQVAEGGRSPIQGLDNPPMAHTLGVEYLVRNAVFLALCLVAARTPNLKFHRLFAAGGLIYEVIYICRQYFSLF